MAGQLILVLAVAVTFASAFVPPYGTELLAQLVADTEEPEVFDRTKRQVTDSPICNTQNLKQCAQTFFNNFGFNNQFPANESFFETALNNYLNVQGVDGWNQIRNWMVTLQNCTGGHQSFDTCFNWMVLMPAWNLDQLNAKLYHVRFITLEYYTFIQFNVLTQNWYCIQGVSVHSGAAVQQCRQAFTNAQNQNPNMTCQHIVDYLVCIEQPYIQHCGRAAGQLVCSSERIAYYVFNPDCSSQIDLRCRGFEENIFEKKSGLGKKIFMKKEN